MGEIKIKDLLYILGGNTKINIVNVSGDQYEDLYKGTVDYINTEGKEYGESEVEHLTVVNGEDYLQIHIIV